MADEPKSQVPGPTKKDHGRAGRDLPKAIASGLTLGALMALTLAFFEPAFLAVVATALVLAIWEMHRGLMTKGIDIPEQPLMVGGVVMLLVAYIWGAPALVTATAVTSLVIMLWVLRRGVSGFVQNATAAVFTLIYVAFLMSFVGLMLNETTSLDYDAGRRGMVVFVLVTVISDIGGYVAGVLFGKHPMAPVISPKKSWEGFAGSVLACVGSGVALTVYFLHAEWWVGILLGVSAAVMATLGDLVESVMKRDLGIKDMSQIIPGHGGIMDRLDSLVATIAPTWLILHFLVFK